MTIKEVLKKAYQKNQLPPEEIDLLLSLSLHRQPSFLYKNPDKKLSIPTYKTFQKLLALRQKKYSLAYLQGHKEFFGLDFLVNKNTLIPRPESEILVNEGLNFLKKIQKPQIIDLGTGTGCLIISLASSLSLSNIPKDDAKYYASDISAKALQVAKTNTRKILSKNKITFIKSNLWSKIPPLKFDLIIANLPYLNTKQLREPSIKREPRLALWGGKNGLELYTKLLANIQKFLAKKFLILLEIDPQQTIDIKKIINQYLPSANTKIIKDLSGLERVIKISN